MHATREAELDQLLRHEVFVDLYAVTRQGIRISKGSYSIKKLEDFYWGHARTAQDDEVADGLSSVVEYERYLVSRESDEPDQSILDAIRAYNEIDVQSTLALHDWLEGRRRELEEQGHVLARPERAQAQEIGDEERGEIALAERLLAAGHEQLAGCVGWHRREQRPEWWDFFRYQFLEPDQLVEDDTVLGGLGGPQPVGTIKRSTVWRYAFPPQDCKLPVGKGKYVRDVEPPFATVGWAKDIDAQAGWIDIVMGSARQPVVPRGVAGPGPLQDRELRASIQRTGELVLAGGESLATRLLDRVVPAPPTLQARPGESPTDVVVRVGQRLSGEVLAVQGPPGTGKTFAGGHLIRALLDRGLRVGVTALSHAVIRNLLAEADRPALHKVTLDEQAADATTEMASGAATDTAEGRRTSAEVDTVGRVGEPGRGTLVAEVGDVDTVASALATGSATLVGGTAWLWSARPSPTPWTCSSSTRRASSRSPTRSPWPPPRRRSCSSATPSS